MFYIVFIVIFYNLQSYEKNFTKTSLFYVFSDILMFCQFFAAIILQNVMF